MLRFIPILLFYITALTYNAWGACFISSTSYAIGNIYHNTCSDLSPNYYKPYTGYPSSCPSVYYKSSVYYINPTFRTPTSSGCASSPYYVDGSGCNCGGVDRCCGHSNAYCDYSMYCTTEAEADSIACELEGGTLINGECVQCGEESCTNYTEHTAVSLDRPSGVVCIGNSCSANYNCAVYSTLVQKCGNNCGDSTTRIISTDTTYYDDTACDPERYFEDCSEEVYCYEMSSNYVIYRKCLTGQIVNGVEAQATKVVSAGSGRCSSVGLLSTDPNQNSASDSLLSGSPADSVSNDCLLFGIGCPLDSSSVNYDSLANRNPQNNCICEPFDGLNFVSVITCPDGSQTTFYGSCDDWSKPASSSSSTTTPEQSSSSAGGGAGSSGVDSGNWPTYSQMSEQLQLQANTNLKLNDVNSNLQALNAGVTSLNNGLAGLTTNNDNTPSADMDSLPADPVLDSSSFVEVSYIDTLTKILSDYIPTENTLIDTSSLPDITSQCLVFTLTKANPQKGVPETKIDLGNLHGYNLCNFSRTTLLLFAEILSIVLMVGIFSKFTGVAV